LKDWVTSHKALIGAVASAIVAVSPLVPPPYNAIPIVIGTVLGGIVGGQLAAKAAFRGPY
jgi:hypothetical protein